MSAMPAVFLPYQQELMSSVSHYAVTVVEKSRRTGYSWAAAAIAVLTAAAQRAAGGMNVYYMGYDLEMAREFIQYCGNWAKQIAPAASEVMEEFFTDPDHPDKQIKNFRIEFASGFSVVALPSVPRALRGKQGLVILDEAAFHSDIEEALKAALALLMWGGKVLILSTHDGDENPFNALVSEIRAGKRPFHLLRCTLDDAIEQGLCRRIFMTLGRQWSPEAEVAWRADLVAQYGDAADEELFCIPREGGGKAIPRALIEKRMVVDQAVLRWKCDSKFVHLDDDIRTAVARDWCEQNLKPLLEKLDPEIPCVFGEDFGRSMDLTCIVPLQIQRHLVRRTPFIVELRNVPFDQQREILFYIADRLPRLRAGKLDAGGNGSYLAEKALQRYGESRIECVKFSELWYRDNMPKLKAAFEDGSIELVRDGDIADDVAMLELVRGVIRVPERTLGSDGEGRHGDAAIALALAWAASVTDVTEYGYEGPPQRRSAAQRDWDGEDDDDPEERARGGLYGGLQGGTMPRRVA